MSHKPRRSDADLMKLAATVAFGKGDVEPARRELRLYLESRGVFGPREAQTEAALQFPFALSR